MKVLFEHEKAVIKFNEEVNSIELHWKNTQDVETYKLLFLKILDFIKEYKTPNFLSDIRKEGVVGAESSKWVQTEIIPKAFSYGLKKIAIVMDEDVFKKFYIKNIEKAAGSEHLKYFDKEASANEWLLEKQFVLK